MQELDFRRIFENSALAFQGIEKYGQRRYLYHELKNEIENRTITILAGPRGVGKTVLLKQLLVEKKDVLYISVDQLAPDESLLELTKVLSKNYKIKYLIFDEIHYNSDFAAGLKAIYDLLDIKIFVTSSIAIKLSELATDLSRRAKFFELFPFSFREFLFFDQKIELPVLNLDEILKRQWQGIHLQFGYLFEKYLSGRLYPFTLEEQNFQSLFRGIYEKIIKVDLQSFGNLTLEDILIVEKLMAFIGRSESEGISVSSLSKNIGVSKYKIEFYLKILSEAYLLQILYPEGTSVTREPKVLMTLPYRLLFKDYADVIGSLREEFVVETLRSLGSLKINYLKGTRGQKTPDFMIVDSSARELIIEVGGKGKGRSQFKGIINPHKYVFVDSSTFREDQYPLYILGMMN